MRLAFMVLGLAVFTSAHAESVYTCTEARGDSVIIEMSRQGENMFLRSLYRKMNFTQSRNRRNNSDYFTFTGRYPGGIGVVSVQESLVRGESGPGVVGNLKIEGHVYPCKTGEGKLEVSKKTRREFSHRGEGGGSCKLTTYWHGMTFMPPRVLCNYGNGIILLRSINGGRPF